MKHASLLPVAVLFALAACSTPPPLTTNCPTVAVLQQASTLTEFLPGRQDIAAQITHAQITGVAGSCTQEKKTHLLKITFQAGFAATNGPANTSQILVLPYIISLSQGDVLLSSSSGSIPMDFSGNSSTASATTKPITFKMPNSSDTAATDILVSFHLTPYQLAYNNAHPGQ